MKSIKYLILIYTLIIVACSSNNKEQDEHANHEPTAIANAYKSPASTAMTNIGNTHVHIEYHSPRIRDRVIFGGLVAYGEVWVTGAHSATNINFYNDVFVDGKRLEKGKYAFFTIPEKEEWTIIFNRNFDQHLADDYDQTEDALRFSVIPESLDTIQEELLYEVIETGNGTGRISVSWAKTKISFEIKEL